MKHFLHKISLFTTAAMLSLASFAQNVEYKGINYILDEESKTAAVTYQGTNPEENNYKGEITLPTKFKYNDVYYRVTSIGETAFGSCCRLASVYCKPTTPPTGGSAMFDNNAANRKIYVPAASVEAYKAADGWSDYADAIVGYEF